MKQEWSGANRRSKVVPKKNVPIRQKRKLKIFSMKYEFKIFGGVLSTLFLQRVP